MSLYNTLIIKKTFNILQNNLLHHNTLQKMQNSVKRKTIRIISTISVKKYVCNNSYYFRTLISKNIPF